MLVSIVNFRTPELTLRCLASLDRERALVPDLRAVVVDNASGDDSVKQIQEGIDAAGYGAWASLVASPENRGYGSGNNLVLQAELEKEEPASFFLILNPDTEILPGGIAKQVAFLDAHPEASLTGPRTESTPGMADPTAFRFPRFLNALSDGFRLGFLDRWCANHRTAPPPRAEAHEAEWVSGGCLLMRREVLETIGLFDEDFFLYFEEVDLCHRARAAGFRTWYVPEAVIMHYAGSSTGIVSGEGGSQRMPGWWFDSRRRYLRKYHNFLYVLFCDSIFFKGRAVWQLRAWIKGKQAVDPPHFLWDFFRFNLLGRRWNRRP